jgi:hypothetical protein
LKITPLRVAATTIGIGAGVLAVYALSERKQVWEVSHGMHGSTVHLCRAPAWAILLEDALQGLPCVHPQAEWTWRVGFGPRADGLPAYSVEAALVRLCSSRHAVVRRLEEHLAQVSVDAATAAKISPRGQRNARRVFGH